MKTSVNMMAQINLSSRSPHGLRGSDNYGATIHATSSGMTPK
ncbi:hypothetical protein [Synechococcus sp. MIT S9504]